VRDNTHAAPLGLSMITTNAKSEPQLHTATRVASVHQPPACYTLLPHVALVDKTEALINTEPTYLAQHGSNIHRLDSDEVGVSSKRYTRSVTDIGVTMFGYTFKISLSITTEHPDIR
jgi:hypothetical protein